MVRGTIFACIKISILNCEAVLEKRKNKLIRKCCRHKKRDNRPIGKHVPCESSCGIKQREEEKSRESLIG